MTARPIGGDRIEYSVRPTTRYHISRYEQQGRTAGASGKGEYDNARTAYEVAYALCKAEHERLGYPPGDMRIIYPEPATAMSMEKRVKIELARIGERLAAYPMPNEHAGLYAAQQALSWALEPGGFRSPFASVTGIVEGPDAEAAARYEMIATQPASPPPNPPAWNLDGSNPNAITAASLKTDSQSTS